LSKFNANQNINKVMNQTVLVDSAITSKDKTVKVVNPPLNNLSPMGSLTSFA